MAYNPYMYNGYQPYYAQPVPDQLAQLRQQQVQQPMMPPQIQSQPIQPSNAIAVNTQNNGIVWVSGKAEADGYLVAPNSAVALWDANNPVIYLRQADSTGKPSTKVYDLVERMENPSVQSTPAIDFTQFITREQLEDILTERFQQSIKNPIIKENTENAQSVSSNYE